MKVKSTDAPTYAANPDDDIIAQALAILGRRVKAGPVLVSPGDVKAYLQLEHARKEHEVFGVLFLDAQHALIHDDAMFRGTINQTSVHPREVVKAALAHNASAVILYHNHPSGNPEPSRSDEHLTDTLKSSLALVDVKVLDHFVIGDTVTSFAERGLI